MGYAYTHAPRIGGMIDRGLVLRFPTTGVVAPYITMKILHPTYRSFLLLAYPHVVRLENTS